jgi:signal transduction histidine kinase
VAFGIVVAALSLGLTVAVASTLLHRSLVDRIDASLQARAQDVVERMLETEDALDAEAVPLPFGGSETFAAIWDDDGVVTRNDDVPLTGLDALEDVANGVATFSLPEVTDVDGAERLRVAVEELPATSLVWNDATDDADPDADTVFVAVGESLSDVDELSSGVARWGAVAVIMLSAGVGGLVWVLTGRALRPVEHLRVEAETISLRESDRRLPEPVRDDELGRLSRTLNRMLDRLSATHLAQRRFVSDASHELRNPIAAIEAQLEVGLRTNDTVSWPVIARTTLGDVHRVRRLVDDLLVLARTDEHGLELRDDLVDIDDVVTAEVASAQATIAVPIIAGHASGAVVRGDAGRLGQAIGNLVANAGRFARTEVRVSVVRGSCRARLLVDDDGPGVPLERRADVFERFARLDDSRVRGDGGSGLGLAITRVITDAHGGYCGVEESPLGGARFWIDLPEQG